MKKSKLMLYPHFIECDDLAIAWAGAFLQLRDSSQKEISPLFLRITGFDDGSVVSENEEIREAVDQCLKTSKEQSAHTVANTIFPEEIYEYANDRTELFDLYMGTMPIRDTCKKNKDGLYFQRLIAFQYKPRASEEENKGPFLNQLDSILNAYEKKSSIRRSMFQASLVDPEKDIYPAIVFDPNRDHSTLPYLPFPCLQHVTFVPNNEEKTLEINAFYATQQIIPKAYGNFLGLCRLGRFMAIEMGLKLKALNCFIGVERMGDKKDCVQPANQLDAKLRTLVLQLAEVEGENFKSARLHSRKQRSANG